MKKHSVPVFFLVLFWVISLWGQTNKGSISGSVFDASGAVVPGATVTITNLGTGHKIILQTTEKGAFQAPNLDPVLYSVEVELPGFKKAVVDSVKVDTATPLTLNVTLQVGEVKTDVVHVIAESVAINAESGAAAQTVVERQIVDMPLNNRSVLDMAMSVANVHGDAGNEDPDLASTIPTPGYNLFVNGGRAGSTNILADGARNTGVGLARAVVTFSPDSVQAVVLPRDFFVFALPQGFHTLPLNSIDITNINGFKLYRMKQAYTPDRFGYLAVTRGAGALAAPYTPRFIQFALKLYF